MFTPMTYPVLFHQLKLDLFGFSFVYIWPGHHNSHISVNIKCTYMHILSTTCIVQINICILQDMHL